MQKPPKSMRDFQSFVEIVTALRGPDGCPWDKEQTHKSLTKYAIEEAAELVDAIEVGDQKEMVDELGDVLLQVVLHSEIGRQSGTFDIHDVIESISEKMVRRHPHVFGDVSVSGSGEVLKNWDEIKKKEGKEKRSRLDVPVNLPALQRSEKLGKRTQKLNFDWSDPENVLLKVKEETTEVEETISDGNENQKVHEIGDLLFTVAQMARHMGVDPEAALRKCNKRFERRFDTMAELIERDSKDLSSLNIKEKEEYWTKSKNSLKELESKE